MSSYDGGINFLPETRKYKTVHSIPKESQEFKFFKDYIELEKLLFSFNPTNKTVEYLYEKIHLVFERNQRNEKLFLQYFVGLLIHYISIRPKQKQIGLCLLSMVLQNFASFQKFIFEIIKENGLFRNYSSIRYFLYSEGILEAQNYNDESIKKEFYYYKEGSLEFILYEDDVEQLKTYINSNDNFSSDATIFFGTYYNLLDVTKLLVSIKQSLYDVQINLLDFCSLYGSQKFLIFLKSMGMNLEIILKK